MVVNYCHSPTTTATPITKQHQLQLGWDQVIVGKHTTVTYHHQDLKATQWCGNIAILRKPKVASFYEKRQNPDSRNSSIGPKKASCNQSKFRSQNGKNCLSFIPIYADTKIDFGPYHGRKIAHWDRKRTQNDTQIRSKSKHRVEDIGCSLICVGTNTNFGPYPSLQNSSIRAKLTPKLGKNYRDPKKDQIGPNKVKSDRKITPKSKSDLKKNKLSSPLWLQI